jgi:hypothetical protein
MRIQPRQQLLETWRAIARASFSDHSWAWGGRRERNSISDAEQLLCLMGPATKIDTFKLDLPDEIAEDVLEALSPLGDSVELPRRLVRVIGDYLRTHRDEDETPDFSGGSYFDSSEPTREPTEAQRRLSLVDSFSMSVQLSLAIIGFLRVFRSVITREDLRREVAEVEEMASIRLTAAMIGLLRSFAVNEFEVSSPEGQALVRTVNQNNWSQRRVVDELHQEFREIKAGLRDLTIGAGSTVDLDNPNRLFECGWSWGITRGAPPIETAEQAGRQEEGIAQAAPYLYYTVVALDGIQDLFTERTRILGLLNEEQHRLARALQIRWDLTQSYWSKVASFGEGRWPLEDIPWRTTDELESDYYSLLVTSIVVTAIENNPAASAELGRVTRVLDDLASRARVTRRPFVNDPAVSLHTPGVPVTLVGSEQVGGPRLSWPVYDFSPQLLKRTLRVAGLLDSSERRGQMLELADNVWDHLLQRRHRSGPGAQLWDQPSEIYSELKPQNPQPTWYYTERVVESLVAAANLMSDAPLQSQPATSLATDLLAEAEHLFDQELLMASSEAGPSLAAVLQTARTTLRRARAILPTRPGTALVLANDVLRELDRLAAARLTSPGAV